MSGLRAVPFDRLGPSELAQWTAVAAATPATAGPYFHPGFAAAVHRSGRAVTVVLDEDAGGHLRMIFPVHRDGAAAVPVGWPGADFQGPVLAAGARLDPAAVLRVLGVRRLAFDHLVTARDELAPWIDGERASPFVDVSGGLEGYLGRASRSGRDNIGQARRRSNKAGRELGEVRFVADSTDPDLLDEVIRLKREQYAATGARDYFAEPARRAMLHDLLGTRDPAFAGALSAVWAGEHLLAAHFGLRSGGILHWWFPVYDPELSRFGPGWILLRELVAAAPAMGVDRIDLGRGDDEYKRRAMTGSVPVAQGLLTSGPVSREIHRLRTAALSAARSSPLAPGLRRAVRTARRAVRP